MMRNGIILVDKPIGPSSAQVVHKTKVSLGVKKAGHLGTLDPFASGLLLVGINEGTKIADIFLKSSKRYRGVIVLGVATDTQDATGKVIETRSLPALGAERLKALENQFTGELQQIPPMFSALKKDGVRLYRLARQGHEVPRAPRTVRVETMSLVQLSESEIDMDVTCSRGTYARTLAADMGAALGCGAHLTSLRRLTCGHLTVEQAVTLDELERSKTVPSESFVSLSAALSHLPAETWDNRWIARLRLGQQELLGQLGKPHSGERLVAILDRQKNLVALAEWSDDIGWRLGRVFRE